MIAEFKQVRHELGAWLAQVVSQEQPGPHIRAYHVGLCPTQLREHAPVSGAVVYLAGHCAPQPGPGDWLAAPPEFVAAARLHLVQLASGRWHLQPCRTTALAVALQEEISAEQWAGFLPLLHSTLDAVLQEEALACSFLGNETPVFAGFDGSNLERIK